ncbi:hypothetical protein BpHYR1_007244 [Brachionus plicatilis]|uniref:Uncharacterized protein n=1 Tax=Brachionus plicatilis TaxID=10195 RepID=A0A3M7T8E4_BRAPC|nr:hypothetical protein BpHYR1_007244 [Brachionus plicatilis]
MLCLIMLIFLFLKIKKRKKELIVFLFNKARARALFPTIKKKSFLFFCDNSFRVRLIRNFWCSSVKLLFSKSILTDYFEESKVNPETLSVQFLIIRSDLCFIIDLNSRIVFLYESELEILDVFSLNLSHLLVVEKSTKIIKLFSNYLIGSRKFSEILVTDYNDSNFIESVACSSPLYQNENCTEIDLACLFRNGDIKLILISFQVPIDQDADSDEENFYFLSDNVTIRFDSESNLSSDEDSDSEIEKRLKFNRINKHIEFTILKTIKSMGPKIERLIKIQSASYSVMKSFDRLNLTRTYISFTNGDLMILNLNARKKNRTLAYLFQSLCPEPILEIEHSLFDELCLVLYTKSSIYLAHSNAKQDEYGKLKGLCLFKLKENFDQVLYLNRNMFFVSSHGIIEGFKLNCLMNRHRTKHLFSINTQSRQVTKLLFSGASLDCGTIDGVFNIFNVFNRKSKVSILPSFDRASDTILKFYHLESLIISSSKNK